MGKALYKGNDNLLEIDGLKNAATDAYINDATVTVTLVTDPGGTEVTGQSWPVTLSYIAASDGNYRTTLKDTLSVTEHDHYTAKITADGGADLRGYWEYPLTAIIRTTESS